MNNKKMNNVIFLDIDGVLNCENAFKNGFCKYNHWGSHENHGYHMAFYPKSKNLLNKLIDETNSKIVISSTWRAMGLDWIKKVWCIENMNGEIIGLTPHITFSSGELAPRGCEIDFYLQSIGFRNINWSSEVQLAYMKHSNLNNYIIIDDDSDMLYNQKEHFVHVKPSPKNKDGFNIEHYNKAINILNENILEIENE